MTCEEFRKAIQEGITGEPRSNEVVGHQRQCKDCEKWVINYDLAHAHKRHHAYQNMMAKRRARLQKVRETRSKKSSEGDKESK